MPRRLASSLAACLALSFAAEASAGPLADWLLERRMQKAQAQGTQPVEVALPQGAEAKKDLSYGPDPQQKLDVYLPARRDHAPVIVMVHGGAWMLGDKGAGNVVTHKVGHWLPKDYAFVTVGYRMSRSPNPVEQADDVARALAFVQAHAAEWHLDTSRLVLMGHSAGAHLVALLAADAAIAKRAGAQPWAATVALDSAALDVPELMGQRHPRFYDDVFGRDEAHWREASPQQRLTGTPSPILLVCSSQRSNSCSAAEAFAKKAQALGARAQVLPVNLSHGEINATLGKQSDYTKQVDAFLSSVGLP